MKLMQTAARICNKPAVQFLIYSAFVYCFTTLDNVRTNTESIHIIGLKFHVSRYLRHTSFHYVIPIHSYSYKNIAVKMQLNIQHSLVGIFWPTLSIPNWSLQL